MYGENVRFLYLTHFFYIKGNDKEIKQLIE